MSSDESAAASRTAETQAVLRAVSLSKRYGPSSAKEPGITLFHQLHLEIAAGEMVAVIGRSGAGKSSLLHLLGGLDRPTSGEVWLGAAALHTLTADQLAALRNRSIGYIWQFHYLLPEFSALENIAMPLRARGQPLREAGVKAQHWLERVGLAHRASHRPGELSGGEQQRVAIARALVTEPVVLLADEPTGDLDGTTATHLLDQLQRLCQEQGLATLMVTHNLEAATRCDRILQLTEGRLEPMTL